MDESDRALLAAMARQIAELTERLAPARPTITVSDVHKSYSAVERKAATQKAYEGRLQPFVAALGAREVASLRIADWTIYRTERAKTHKSSTLNLELGVIRAMFRWAVGQELIATDPFALAKRIKTRKHRETAPVPTEIDALLLEAGILQRVVILAAADAGLRCSEICSLSWDWVDRDRMAIALPNWACKGERGGVVPMTRRLLEAIEAVPRTLRSPYVLSSPRGPDGRYNRRTISRWWRAAADAAGLLAAPGDGKVHLHDGRHAAASQAVASGVPIEVVSRSLLRHSSIAQTLAYVQTPPPDLEAMRKTIERGIERSRTRR